MQFSGRCARFEHETAGLAPAVSFQASYFIAALQVRAALADAASG